MQLNLIRDEDARKALGIPSGMGSFQTLATIVYLIEKKSGFSGDGVIDEGNVVPDRVDKCEAEMLELEKKLCI